MEKFIITTNSETASNIQKFFRSGILSEGRSIVLGGVSEHPGFTDVLITSSKEDEPIKPEDIFWMGFYSNNK